MEIRKIQNTGGSSYIVTLPKDWIKKHHIKKNDPVKMIIQPNGTLLITPHVTGDNNKMIKDINIDEDISSGANYIFRKLIGTYIMGYSQIDIQSKYRINPSARQPVRKFVQIAIGPEIIEETDKSIVIKDLLSPTEMPFDKTIKRLYIIIKTMHEDALSVLLTGNAELAQEINNRDTEVDRLQWLIAHQYNIVSRDATLLGRMGISQVDAMFYFLISRIFERIGDHAVRIARSGLELTDLSQSIKKHIESASHTAIGLFEKAIKSWNIKDIKGANEAIEAVPTVIQQCELLNDMSIKEELKTLPMSYVSESIKRTGEYSADIAELVINHLLSKD